MKTWDDNLASVLTALFNLIREFKIVVSIIVLGAAITLGWLDVPIFSTIIDGLAKLASAAIPGIGLGQ